MNPLHKFYIDKEVYNEVKKYLIEHLKEVTIERAFEGKDTTGIKEAKIAVDNAFNQLERQFGEKKTQTANSSE